MEYYGTDLEPFIKMTLNKNRNVRMMLLYLETKMTNFIMESKQQCYKFHQMSSYHRMLVHRVSACFGLDHIVDRSGRCVVVSRTTNTRIPDFRFSDHIYDMTDDEEPRKLLKRGDGPHAHGGSLHEGPLKKARTERIRGKLQQPVSPPVDQSPPVSPPVDQSPPVSPPVDQSPPVSPPVDQSPPVSPPVDQSPHVSPPVDQSPPVSPPVDQSPPVDILRNLPKCHPRRRRVARGKRARRVARNLQSPLHKPSSLQSSQRNSTLFRSKIWRIDWQGYPMEGFSEISKWKAGHVLSWVENEMNMPMYGKTCSKNIKSGKILLGLSDSDLDSALCVESPLHCLKLRLAIEELRDPNTVQYQDAAIIDHTWVATHFLPDLGLPQYSRAFKSGLVDGRMLNVLTAEDLESKLGVSKEFHQQSILYGVQLMRMVEYNKEELSCRRATSADLVMWSNGRLQQWLINIDLHEYAGYLQESGVHGAVLVWDDLYKADALATTLKIKSLFVRRHLAAELASIFPPPRVTMSCNKVDQDRNIGTVAHGHVAPSASQQWKNTKDMSKQKVGSQLSGDEDDHVYTE